MLPVSCHHTGWCNMHLQLYRVCKLVPQVAVIIYTPTDSCMSPYFPTFSPKLIGICLITFAREIENKHLSLCLLVFWGFFTCWLPAPVPFLIFWLFLFLADWNASFIYTECYFSLNWKKKSSPNLGFVIAFDLRCGFQFWRDQHCQSFSGFAFYNYLLKFFPNPLP